MTTLHLIQQSAERYPDGKVIFTEQLKVKSTPHHEVFTAWGIWTGPAGLYVMDGAGNWHGPLNEKQAYGPLMINSIYQRVKAMELRPSVVIASYDHDVNATIVE